MTEPARPAGLPGFHWTDQPHECGTECAAAAARIRAALSEPDPEAECTCVPGRPGGCAAHPFDTVRRARVSGFSVRSDGTVVRFGPTEYRR